MAPTALGAHALAHKQHRQPQGSLTLQFDKPQIQRHGRELFVQQPIGSSLKIHSSYEKVFIAVLERTDQTQHNI